MHREQGQLILRMTGGGLRGRCTFPLWVERSLLGLLTFLTFALTAWYGSRQNTDTWAAALSAWQVGQHGTFDLSQYHGDVPWDVRVGDHVYTNRMPGVVLSAAPFYWLLGDPLQATTYPAGIAAAGWAAVAVVAGTCGVFTVGFSPYCAGCRARFRLRHAHLVRVSRQSVVTWAEPGSDLVVSARAVEVEVCLVWTRIRYVRAVSPASVGRCCRDGCLRRLEGKVCSPPADLRRCGQDCRRRNTHRVQPAALSRMVSHRWLF